MYALATFVALDYIHLVSIVLPITLVTFFLNYLVTFVERLFL